MRFLPEPQQPPPVTELANALFPKARQRVLGLLFGNPGRSFYGNEIVVLAACGTGAVQRELERLSAAGLVKITRLGKQKHYQANASASIFEELRGLVLKSFFGYTDVLRVALTPLADEISSAFVYGAVVRMPDDAASAIDLLVVSDSLNAAGLSHTLDGAASQLGRPVRATVCSQRELTERARNDKSFVAQVLAQPKISLLGRGYELAA